MYKFLLTALMAVPVHANAADPWPSQPIQLVVPFSAGGPTDSLARYLADRLQPQFNTPIIVENKAGAGGLIGARYAARSKADGYTFLIGSADLFAKTSPLASAEYEPLRDLDAVAKLTESYVVLAASNTLGAKSIDDLQKLAATPDTIKCGSAGIATVGHYLCADLANKLGVQFLHIPFKGMSDATNALLGGVIDISLNPSIIPHVKAGNAWPLAAGTDRRIADLPDVPAFAELSIDLQVPTWFGIAAPAGVPPAILKQMSDALERIMADPQTAKIIEPFGQYADFANTEVFVQENLKARDNLVLMEKIADIR